MKTEKELKDEYDELLYRWVNAKTKKESNKYFKLIAKNQREIPKNENDKEKI